MKHLIITLILFTSLFAKDYYDALKLYEEENFKEAFKLFKELAQSDSDSAYYLAKMYEEGIGCDENEIESLKWYKQSAIAFHKQNQKDPEYKVKKKQEILLNNLDKSKDIRTQKTINQFTRSLYNFKAYQANYFLPISYRYDGDYADTNGHNAQEVETEFQFSLAYDIGSDIFDLAEVYTVAYTQKSFWQFYSNSAYFRESNYNPEFFVTIPTSDINDGRLLKSIKLGIAHESNGRGGDEERSWNYLSSSFLFQYKTLFTELKLWARLSDSFDYNPDLLDYLGHGHLKFTLAYKENLFDLKLRNNFSTNKGSIELSHSYPIFGRDDLFLYTKIFNGYGESLIDYNNHIKKFGIGFSISR